MSRGGWTVQGAPPWATIGAYAIAGVALFTVRPANARPVPIGRYVEIPYGVSPEHPHCTDGVDRGRSGQSRAILPERTPSLRWEAEVSGASERTGVRLWPPTVTADGMIFVSSTEGLAAFASDGQVRWNMRLGYTTGSPSLAPGNSVVVGTQSGQVVTVSRFGQVTMRARIGGALRGSPLVLDDGSIVGPAFDSALHRLDAEGRRIFRLQLTAQAPGPAAWTSRGRIVVASGRRVIFVTPGGLIDAETLLPEQVAEGPIVGADASVWVRTIDGGVYAIEHDGSVRVSAMTGIRPSAVSGIAAGSDGAVRVAGIDDGIVAIGGTGTERFRLAGGGVFGSGLLLDANHAIAAATNDGELLAFDATGQRTLWSFLTSRGVQGPPVLGADGTIYLVVEGARLQALR